MSGISRHDDDDASKSNLWILTSTKLSNEIATMHKRPHFELIKNFSDPILTKDCYEFYKESKLQRSRMTKDYRSKLLTIQVFFVNSFT